ncbi:M42 family metallopeptidase [SAR202 cluster bacterium AC-647-P02_OGT_505m]|nr:M42 family metallopeptidase [SAR202 cluster bacterium AC-647-P02_OGT_505m]
MSIDSKNYINAYPVGKRALDILKLLGGCPATSFHEGLVSRRIVDILDASKIDYRVDMYGNIIARVDGNLEAESESLPIAFVAHMDHPGFEVVRYEEELPIATSLGGVPLASLTKGANAFYFDEKGNRFKCELEPIPGDQNELLVKSSVLPPVGAPIVFALDDFSISEDILRMRAMDDLAGCAAIIASLEELKNNPSASEVYGVFTRAEEVGLIGARLLSLEKTLPQNTFVVSVETSSIIPGVTQGEGPVIRTGDASYTFNSEAEQILIMGREAIKSSDSDFKCQRQLMSAGSCEASAFAVNGYRTTGIAFPLGNWHNATTTIRDPNGGVGDEYISVYDFIGGVRLIESSARNVATRNNSPLPSRYRTVPEEQKMRLTSTSD